MKRLYLIRHAKSSWKDSSLSDFDRPLNKRGKHDAPLMGRVLREKAVEIDAIISSPAMRAKLTAIEIAKGLGFESEKIQFESGIYEASTHRLKSIITEFPESINSAILIGHNPGFTYLAEDLTTEYFGNIPTCGMVGIEFPVTQWNHISSDSGFSIFYEYPKKFY